MGLPRLEVRQQVDVGRTKEALLGGGVPSTLFTIAPIFRNTVPAHLPDGPDSYHSVSRLVGGNRKTMGWRLSAVVHLGNVKVS